MQVVDTDKFLDMPTSTQALYFHLGMHGDDDGFVSSPKKIARAAGCGDDDLRLLAAKDFIIPFDSGVVVITDWKINNTLKNDRYRGTIWEAEKAKIYEERSGRFALGTNLEPQHNITEHNKTEPSKTEDRAAGKPPVVSAEFEKFWSAYPKKVGKQAAKKAFSRVKVPVETLLAALERQKCSAQWSKDNGQYVPNPATWLNQGRWEDELTPIQCSGKEQINGKTEFQFAGRIGTVV